MIPLCRDRGVGLIPWSPLARGRLTGNKRQGTVRSETDEFGNLMYDRPMDERVIDRLNEVAAARGAPAAQVALAWLLSKPWITAPIVGASKPHHLKDALAAVALRLSDEEVRRLEEPYEPHPVLGHA